MLTIEDYSQKSFVVRGASDEHSDQLTKFCGKFNRNLRNGEGWIFANKRKPDVERFITAANGQIPEFITDAISPIDLLKEIEQELADIDGVKYHTLTYNVPTPQLGMILKVEFTDEIKEYQVISINDQLDFMTLQGARGATDITVACVKCGIWQLDSEPRGHLIIF